MRRWIRSTSHSTLTPIFVLLLVTSLSAIPSIDGTAFPSPRGDPDAHHGHRPTGHKHALLEFVETAEPLTPPSRDWISSDSKSWLAHGDLAAAFALTLFHTLEVPIYVNILAVGLDGFGNLGVDIFEEELEEWMQHLDHIVSHQVLKSNEADQNEEERDVDQLEHTSRLTKHGKSRAFKEEEIEKQAEPAKIQYKYHARLIHLSPKVIQVVERYLAVHYRVENKEHTSFQVDAEIMNGVLEGLVKHLHIDDAYNLFVLNPSTSWLTVPASVSKDTPITYGYRSGFSNDELDALVDFEKSKDAGVKVFVRDWKQKPQADYTQQLLKNDESPQPIPTFTPKTEDEIASKAAAPKPQLEIFDHRASSESWAESVLNAPHFTGPQPLSLYLNQQLDHHPEVLRSSLFNEYASEDCLTDNWIGRGRTLFVDLSAGPFRFGPIVSGEGVRTNTSFPSMKTFVSQLKKEKEEEQNEDPYVDASYDADAVAAELAVLEDILVQRKCGVSLEEAKVSSNPECRKVAEKLQDLIEWSSEHGHRIIDTENGRSLAPKEKAPSLDSIEGLSFFHDDASEGAASADGATSGHDSSIEIDHFLAHLSSTLSSSFHHAITPTVADTTRSHGYAQQVNFHLNVLVNHQQYDPLANQFFPRLKYGLEQLRLPSQLFTYTVHKLTMDDDPTLAMAYTNSLRTTVVPSILADGRFSAIKRLYIDSELLQTQLNGLNMEEKAAKDNIFGESNRASTASAKAAAESSKFSSTRTRDIPIFLFSLDFPLPVLVDKFYQSQAVPQANMVVAVQSNLHLWESPMICNSSPMFWNLRDPLRAILSSTAHVLGGLLPLHIKYSPAHGRVTQDWLWSVGLSPLSLTTSQGIEFSQIQKDTLHRNYVLTSWIHATELVNLAIQLLSREKTTLSNRKLGGVKDEATSGEVARNSTLVQLPIQLRAAYIAFSDTITREMIPAMEEFHFDSATRAIDQLYQQANIFSKLVRDILAYTRRDRCSSNTPTTRTTTSRSRFQLSYHWYLFTAIICIAILLYRLIVQRNDKPKLN